MIILYDFPVLHLAVLRLNKFFSRLDDWLVGWSINRPGTNLHSSFFLTTSKAYSHASQVAEYHALFVKGHCQWNSAFSSPDLMAFWILQPGSIGTTFLQASVTLFHLF